MRFPGLRVLVVEDEAIIAMLLEEYLGELGCAVVATAARLGDAVDKARRLELDVALLDVNLAGELSYPVAEVLRGRGVPFVLSTGYGVAALPEALRGALVLSKPYQRQDLVSALQTIRAGTAP